MHLTLHHSIGAGLLTSMLCMVLSLTGWDLAAQNSSTKVSGTVTDASGEAVIGASVMIKGTKSGTVSDIDGTYSISARTSDILVFSSIGFESQEIGVGDKSVINVTLNDDIRLLEEVVVTGYQTISKERATGSFDIISKAQIEKPTGNIASRLIGSAAGLSYSTDIYGNPTFSIRGTSTFSAGSAPLLVVDGFPVEGGFESINPNDVESVSILKDAAAASIWGAKSANGVIVVTTKNAKQESGRTKVTVDYSGFYRFSPKIDLDYALSYADTDDVIDYEVANFTKWDASSSYPEEMSYRGGNSSVYSILNEERLGHLNYSEAINKINEYRGKSNYDQLREYILQNSSTMQHNVSINVGTDRSQNTISLLFQDDDKIYQKMGSDKYMVSLRNKTQIFKWLDLNLNASYSFTKSNNSGEGLPEWAPYEMLVDENGNTIPHEFGYSFHYLERHVPLENFPYSDWSYNPVQERDARDFTSTSTMTRVQAGLTFKITKALNFDFRAQYELIDGYTHNYYSEDTYTVRTGINNTSSWDKATNKVTLNLPEGGFLDQSSSKRTVATFRGQANYNRTFAGKHTVAAIAGMEATDNVRQSFGYPRTYGYNDNTLTVGIFPNGVGGTGNLVINNWQGSSQVFEYVNSFTYYTDRYFSAFANASYTYDGKYTLSGSARTDASNLITDDPKYRYAPFWSVGASWQLGKEDFIKDLGWVNTLTVRATFGHNGNVDKSTTFKPLIDVSDTPSVITGLHTASMSSYGNPTLRWERTKTLDLGVDFNFFHNKLRGKIDVYNKHSFDLIANKTIPWVQGTSSMRLNNGEISNKGIELEIGSTIPIARGIEWEGTATFSYNRNRVLALEQKPTNAYTLVYGSKSSTWMEGYDMNTLWSYKYGGLINKGSDSNPDWQPSIVGKDDVHQTMSTWPTGDAMNISYMQGTTEAPVAASLNSSFKVYDFELSFILAGKFGHVFRRESFNYPSIKGLDFPNSKYREIIDCDPAERVPLPLNDREQNFSFWNRFYPFLSYLTESAAVIRVQEINFGYNIPSKVTKVLGINSLKVYFQTNNPFSIYFNSWGEDPEFPRGSNPLLSTYMFGIKCNF